MQHSFEKFLIYTILVIFVFVVLAVSVGIALRSPGNAMVANNVMAIVGILVVGSNLFRPGLQMTRELRVLKSGIVIFGITALYENIAPLLTPGYEISDLEPFGFLVFIGCLVYVVAYRFFHNEKDLITITHELETARQIRLIEHISNWSGKRLDKALDDDLTLVMADFRSN